MSAKHRVGFSGVSGTAGPLSITVAILASVLLRVIRFPLLDQPRFHESTQEPLPCFDRVRLQRVQEFGQVVHGDVDALGEFDEGEGIPRFRRSCTGLGNRFMEFAQGIGGHLRAHHGFGHTVEEPGLEGIRRIRRGRRTRGIHVRSTPAQRDVGNRRAAICCWR